MCATTPSNHLFQFFQSSAFKDHGTGFCFVFVYTCSFLAREGLSSYEFTWIRIRSITPSKHLIYLPNLTSVKRTLGNVHLNLFLFGSYTGLNTDPCMISKHSITELYSISNALGNVNLKMSNTLPTTKSYCDVYYTFTKDQSDTNQSYQQACYYYSNFDGL